MVTFLCTAEVSAKFFMRRCDTGEGGDLPVVAKFKVKSKCQKAFHEKVRFWAEEGGGGDFTR